MALIVSATLIAAAGCEKHIKDVRTNDGRELVATNK